MKRILVGIAILVGLLLVAALVVPFLVPASVYKAQIESAATKALQRDVALNGDVSISVFPRISASIEDVTVANPDGFDGDHMITAGALRGSVKWGPLLSRRVDVQELAFIDATVDLQRRADGETNWAFGGEEAAPQSEETDNEGGQGFSAGIEEAKLVNAALTYRDAVTGAQYNIKALNAVASVQDLAKPVSLQADGLFDDQPFEIDVRLGTPEAAMSGAPADARLNAKTAYGTVAYDGSLTLGDTPGLDGAFEVASDQLAALAERLGVDMPVDIARLGALQAKGRVRGPLSTLALDIESFTQSSDLARTSYSGAVTLGETPGLDGSLTVNAASLAALADFAGVTDLPVNLAPLGSGEIKARVSGPATAPTLDFETLKLKGAQLSADYSGSASLQKALQLDGALTITSSDMGDLITALGVDLPAADALDQLDLSTQLKGPADALQLTNIDARHSGALLNATYKGAATVSEAGQIDGRIEAASGQLRQLLDALDIEMAPGETLQSFDVKGDVTGSFSKLNLSGLTLALDDVSATGDARIDVSGDRPRLGATLSTETLDLTPFLGDGSASSGQSTAGSASGWSKTPLDLAGLNAANLDLNIKAGTIRFGDTELKQADLGATLTNGQLATDIRGFQAFGGGWTGKASLDAGGAVPRVSFNMQGSAISASDLLGTFASIDRLTGTGGFTLQGSASGASLHDIMNDLDGELKADLSNGALKGINIAQLVRSVSSLQDAVRNGSLNALDFQSVLSPQAETDFTSFDSVLTVKDGVAQVNVLELLNPLLGLDGSGQIDLGGRKLDLRLKTSIDETASGQGSVVQLNGIPVPIRLSGDWTNLKITPDLSGVQQALQAEIGNQIRDEISNAIGGGEGGSVEDALGGILGDALGVPRPSNDNQPATPDQPVAPSEPEAPEETAPQKEEEPKTVEDALEDAAKDALKDLFGGGN